MNIHRKVNIVKYLYDLSKGLFIGVFAAFAMQDDLNNLEQIAVAGLFGVTIIFIFAYLLDRSMYND